MEEAGVQTGAYGVSGLESAIEAQEDIHAVGAGEGAPGREIEGVGVAGSPNDVLIENLGAVR